LFSRKQRFETPFLKGYIRRSRAYPSYVPSWVGPGAWGLFALLFAISIPIELKGLGVVLAGVIAWAASLIVSGLYRPVSDEDRFDERAYAAVRRLKFLYAQGIGNSIPSRILMSLERAVEAYNTACARLPLHDPAGHANAQAALERLLHACFVAAMPMIKDDQHSRKEWQAMKQNNELIGRIVEAIDEQTAEMLAFSPTTHTRLAALGELGLLSQAETPSPTLAEIRAAGQE
jgi:hypothetical protein